MRQNILTVDDSKAMRQFVEKSLRAFDCEVNESNNGFNAFFAIERTRPHLLLLDVNMPVMDGVEMLTRMKSHAELADIPVIMLASPADHALLEKLRTLGACDILMKPINEKTLLAAIQSVIALNPAKV